jgi:hypothetical protein
MEQLLFKCLVFLRPIFEIDTGLVVGGLRVSEIGSLLLSVAMVATFAIRAATHRDRIRWSFADLAIAGFTVWCITIYLVYLEKAHIADLAKFTLPMLTFVVAKNVIQSRQDYLKTVWLLILGFAVPVLASAVLILSGGGLDRITYWTGTPRYEGLYDGMHTMAHNTTLLVIVIWLYIVVGEQDKTRQTGLGAGKKVFFAILIAAALYCWYETRVRTTIVGLGVVAIILFLKYYRNPLPLIVGAVIIAGSVALSSGLQERLFPEETMMERTGNYDVELYGSGRPMIWMTQLRAFQELPVDQEIAGFGIGNMFAKEDVTGQEWLLRKDSHNDYLRVMFHTGVIGLILFITVQLAILHSILRLDGKVKYAFLALFAAVAVMNALSNSYVMRFGVAQVYYIVMAYVEVLRTREAFGPTGAYRKGE